jgi:hypothetical protein
MLKAATTNRLLICGRRSWNFASRSDREHSSVTHLPTCHCERRCAALESEGVKCWIARVTSRRAVYAANIVHALDRTAVLVLVRPPPQRQRMCLGSRTSSSKRTYFIFPIDHTSSESLEYFLNTSQWLDAVLPGRIGHCRRRGRESVSAKSTAAALVNRAPLVAANAAKRSSRMLLTLAVIIARLLHLQW